jgi:hypothetical protein
MVERGPGIPMWRNPVEDSLWCSSGISILLHQVVGTIGCKHVVKREVDVARRGRDVVTGLK